MHMDHTARPGTAYGLSGRERCESPGPEERVVPILRQLQPPSRRPYRHGARLGPKLGSRSRRAICRSRESSRAPTRRADLDSLGGRSAESQHRARDRGARNRSGWSSRRAELRRRSRSNRRTVPRRCRVGAPRFRREPAAAGGGRSHEDPRRNRRFARRARRAEIRNEARRRERGRGADRPDGVREPETGVAGTNGSSRKEQAELVLAKAAREVSRQGSPPARFELVRPVDEVPEAISRAADRLQADLVVVESEGRDSLTESVVGGTALRLIYVARRPVTVVRAPRRRSAR